MRNYWLWTAVLIAAALVIISILTSTYPSTLDDDYSVARVIYLLMLLAFIGSGFFATQRMRLSTAIKQAAIWIAIFAILVVGYSYRDDFGIIYNEVSGEVAPSLARANGSGELVLHRGSDGHFSVNAKVNDSRIDFMVDTGATLVALTYADAERARLEPWNLTYDRQVRTAGGIIAVAPVQIQSISVGDMTVHNVAGFVMKESSQSLLGMSFLDRLGSYEVKGNKLTLRK